MSFDMGPLVTKWGVLVDAFNHDDLAPMADALAEKCEFVASGTRVGSSGDEIIAGLKQARADGWLRHLPLSVSVGGQFLVSVYRNEYADGTSFIGAGIMRFDDDGKICELIALDPPENRPNQ